MTTTSYRLIAARYAGTCESCGSDVAPRDQVWWNPATHAVQCKTCESPPPADPFAADANAVRGVPGASAGAISRRPNDSWAKGEVGEQRVGEMLNVLAAQGSIAALHDLAVPGSKANIDHIAITKRGVYVIDAKKYKGRIAKHVPEGLFRPTQLRIGGRDRTKLVRGVEGQTKIVRAALAATKERTGFRGVKVYGVLCFVDGDWPWPPIAFSVDGILIRWPDKLRRDLLKDGPGPAQTALSYKLAQTLPPR